MFGENYKLSHDFDFDYTGRGIKWVSIVGNLNEVTSNGRIYSESAMRLAINHYINNDYSIDHDSRSYGNIE